MRKLTTSTTAPTAERVAKHRERQKDAGLKRLDLSVSPESFESLKVWANLNKLTYSEAAEQLFLAASAPVSSYLPTVLQQYETGEILGQSMPKSVDFCASAALNSMPIASAQSTSILRSEPTAVSAFFASRQAATSSQPKGDNHDDKKSK